MRKKQCNTENLFDSTDDFELEVTIEEVSEKEILPGGEVVSTHSVVKTMTFTKKGSARNKSKSSSYAAKFIILAVVPFVGLLADIPSAMSFIKSLL